MKSNFVIVDPNEQQWKMELQMLKTHQKLQEIEMKSNLLKYAGLVMFGLTYFTIVILERRNKE